MTEGSGFSFRQPVKGPVVQNAGPFLPQPAGLDMAGLSYLVHRGGTLHFRAAIPFDLRPRLGRTEFRISLGTGRLREARDKALALAVFVRRLIRELRKGAMADLTSDEIFEMARQEFKRILEEDRKSRMRFPGEYEFKARVPVKGPLDANWRELTELDPWDHLTAKEAEPIIRGKLRNGQWPDLKKPVLDLLKRNGYDILSDDPLVNEICHVYAQGMIEAFTAIREREHGLVDYLPVVFHDDQSLSDPTKQIEQVKKPEKRLLSGLVNEYCGEKRQHGWTARSDRTITERLNHLIELMGDVQLETINYDFAFRFRKKLMEKPRKKQSAESKSSGLLESIAPGTVNNIITDIAAMFKYAKKRDWIANNYFSEMTLRDTTPAHKKRQAFTKEEIALLLGPRFLDACGKIPWRFWVPLLGLFTGARLDEIAQAHVDDVREVDGIWCLVIESSDTKSVKTISGNRSIPLHPFLIEELNFLGFVEAQRANGELELFPALKRVQGRKGHYLTKWFGDYRDALGIQKTRTFHSLRKNFSKCLAVNDVPANMIKRLDGHSLASDVTEYHYIQEIPVTKLVEYIARLDFGVDLSHLKESRFVLKG